MASNGRAACPCCVRRAEQMLDLARRRIVSALAAAGLAAVAILCWSAAGAGSGPVDRVILAAAAAAVAAAFIIVPRLARAFRRPAEADWRSWPPGYDPWAGR